jgi:hypothetical protein
VNFWTGLRLAHFGHRLKSPDHDIRAQHAAFARLMNQLARTSFGRSQGITARMSYTDFREKIAPRPYASFAPHLNRMAAGESGVLVPGKCPLFVETAGTTGPPKLLPVPEAMLAHFRKALSDALFHHAHRAGHTGVFLGRHLQLGASTAVRETHGIHRTSLEGILTLCVSRWVDANLCAPPGRVAQMPEGTEKIAATAATMLKRDVTLIGGTPASLQALAETVLKSVGLDKSDASLLETVWPNLECCVHTGTPLGFFEDSLRPLLGSAVKFHEIYAAAEGIFAAQDGGHPAAMRLISDAGVFFEFLPAAEYHESTVERAGAHCLPLEKIKTGTDYVLIVTTPAGLCRYATGDIVHFVTASPPRLRFVGRAGFRLNTVGENVSEYDLFKSLQAVCSRHGWSPIAFHVAPYEQRLGPGLVAHVHEWWLELGTHTVKTPMANVLGPELDSELLRRNADYAQRRRNNLLGAPQIRLVIPGVFERWSQQQGVSAGARKILPCRPDRLVADQLASLAPFHQPAIISGK